MKPQSRGRRLRCKFQQMVGACFGLLNVSRPKTGRPCAGRGGVTVISGPQGIYFLPEKMR